MSLSYAHEKFRNAVYTLATHPADIRERPISALVPHIGSVEIEQDIPEDLQDEYQAFWNRVTFGVPISGEGTLQASVREMSDDEAVEVAKLITQFAYEFRGRLGR